MSLYEAVLESPLTVDDCGGIGAGFTGDAAKVSLINGVNTAELSLEPSELALSTGGQRIALRPGGGVGVEVHSLLQVSSTITSASGNFLQLQSATNEIRVGQSTGSVTITRTPLTSGGVGSSTTISGQDSSLGTGGDLLLRAGLGSTVPGNVIIAGNTGGKVELGASTGATLVHSDMAVNQDLAVVGEATFSSGVSVCCWLQIPSLLCTCLKSGSSVFGVGDAEWVTSTHTDLCIFVHVYVHWKHTHT